MPSPKPNAGPDKTRRAREIAEEIAAKVTSRKSGPAAQGDRGGFAEGSAEAADAKLQLLLPGFMPDERGMPNALARGAIFNAAKTGDTVKRVFHENRLVASLSNMRVEYQGQELRQDDCSVFMALLYFQQDIPIGEPVYFTAYGMLKELGWSLNADEYRHLRECCTRLAATALSISFSDGKLGFTGSLLRNFTWRDEDNKQMSRWCAQFETSIARFFEEDSFSIIDPRIRRKISGRAPLAQWLHNFFSTHREPFPMSIEKYHELSDSRAKDLSDFRSRMKHALTRLIEHGFLESFTIRDDMVHVKRVKFLYTKPKNRTRQRLEALVA